MSLTRRSFGAAVEGGAGALGAPWEAVKRPRTRTCWGAGFGVQGFGFRRVLDLGFKVEDLGLRVWD